MLRLPITIVLIDSVAHELSREAINASLQLIEPEEVLIFTNDAKRLNIPGASYRAYSGNSIEDYNRCLWYTVPLCIHTSHFLVMQWDGEIINPDSWTDYFLNYDYIGAPWPWYKDLNRVGNGGFSFRSTALALNLMINKNSFLPLHPEDAHICRVYRDKLSLSTHYAEEALAYKFAIEHGGGDWGNSTNHYVCTNDNWACGDCDPCVKYESSPFGFHDCRNWPRAFRAGVLQERLAIGRTIPHIANKPEFKQLLWKLPNGMNE